MTNPPELRQPQPVEPPAYARAPIQQAFAPPSGKPTKPIGRKFLAGIAAIAGLIVGASASAIYAEGVTIPKWEARVEAVTVERDDARAAQKAAADRNEAMRGRADVANDRAEAAEAKLTEAQEGMAEREAAVKEAEGKIVGREAAVAKTEDAIAASSITEGTWTVGRDIAAGSYVTKDLVVDSCYWSITRGGSNGGDIVENDNVSGGRPTVSLSNGQVFTTERCGSWVKE